MEKNIINSENKINNKNDYEEEGNLSLMNLHYENDNNLRLKYNIEKKNLIKTYLLFKNSNNNQKILEKLEIYYKFIKKKSKKKIIQKDKKKEEKIENTNDKKRKKKKSIKEINHKNILNICEDSFDKLLEVYYKIKTDKKKKLLFLENPESFLENSILYHPNYLKKLKKLLI